MTTCEITLKEASNSVVLTEAENCVTTITDSPSTIVTSSNTIINGTFKLLTDTPSTYTGSENYLVRVNSAGDGIEFVSSEVVEDINWGEISGTLSNQTDLQNALNLKYDAADYNADFDTRFSSKTTTDLTEGTNLYYTDVRAIAALNPHTSDATIHFTEGSIDHANIQNIGTNTHAQIDTFIGTTVPNTYIPYTGATGNVDLGANNLTVDTDTLFVDSVNNRVGVGTDSPSAPLTIKNGTTSDIHLRSNTLNQGEHKIKFGFVADNFDSYSAAIVGKSNGFSGRGKIEFWVNDTASDSAQVSSVDKVLEINSNGIKNFSDTFRIGLATNSGAKVYRFTPNESKAGVWSQPSGSFGGGDIRFTTGNNTSSAENTINDATVKIDYSGGVAIGNSYISSAVSDGVLVVSDNVGIGTSVPQHGLHVHNFTTDNTLQALFENTSGGQPAGFRMSNGGWDIGFRTNPGKGWFEITSSGGIIQHRWNAKDYMLASSGKLLFSSESDFSTGGVGSADTNLFRNSANVLRTNDSFIVDGSLGIGTASPSAKLDVTSGRVNFDVNTDDDPNNFIDLGGGFGKSKIYTRGNNDWIVFESTFRNVFKSASNIFDGGSFLLENGANELEFYQGTIADLSSEDNQTTFAWGGDFSTPIVLSGRAKNADQFMVNRKISGATGNLLSLAEQGVRQFVVDSSGNVGIGTDSPDETLHVVGNIKARKTESGTQDSLLKILSTQDSSVADRNWRGRAIYGADNITTLMGVYKGVASIGAHSWSSANNGTGAAWEDFYIQPAGSMKTYIGNTGSFTSLTAILTVDNSTGNVGIGTSSPTAKLDIDSDILRLRTAKTPSSATDTGNQGDIAWDADYIYICTATDTWKRSAISTW